MQPARASALLLCLLAPFLDATQVAAAISAVGPLALDSGPIRPRRDVPDDPLAGLPTDDGGRSGKGKGGAGKAPAACTVDAKPVNPREIGDLRATLALVQRGPKSWPCPPRSAGRSAVLRVTIDGAGKVTAAEPTGGASEVAAAIAKRLTGKSIAPRPQGATTGSVLLTFSPGKAR
jgi:hypothetical protein